MILSIKGDSCFLIQTKIGLIITASRLIVSQLRHPWPRFLTVPRPSRGITGPPGAYCRNRAASTTALALIITNKIPLEPVPLCQLLIIPTRSCFTSFSSISLGSLRWYLSYFMWPLLDYRISSPLGSRGIIEDKSDIIPRHPAILSVSKS